jgi:hypothetical protein
LHVGARAAQQPALPDDQHPGVTDIASSSSATARPTRRPRPEVREQSLHVRAAPLLRPSTSSMSNRPGPRPARKRAARRLPCGVVGAAAAAVGDLDALAGAGEQHGVVADDVAAAHGGKADRAGSRSPVWPSRA